MFVINLLLILIQINEEAYTKEFNVENLIQSLKNELKNQFGMEFGISVTWLNCGSLSKNPLEKVLFFKKPLHDNKSIILDNTQYQNLYPMNE